MKNIVIGILLVSTVVFGGFYIQQTRKTSQAEAGADALQKKIDELQSGLEAQARQTTRLSDQLEETRADAEARAREAVRMEEALQASLTNQAKATAQAAGPTNARPSNPLADMFKDPKMKEMIKNQQKTALGAMIDKNYRKFFTDANLTPEQSAALKDMIINKQLGAADLGLSMFSGDQDATNRMELVQQVKAANDAADAQIKQFLGDDGFAQFQTYEKSVGERMSVSGFADQLGTGPGALTDDQQEQLIQAMTQQQQNFKFTTDFSDKAKLTGDFASMFTEDKMNTYSQELAQLNQEYLAKAQGILTPDQLTAFQQYLDNQQTMQKAGMQMAAKMFAPAKPGGN